MSSCIYKTFTPNGSHYDQNLDDALEYCKKNDGFLIVSKTKDLFPEYSVILENTYKTGRVWILAKKYRTI